MSNQVSDPNSDDAPEYPITRVIDELAHARNRMNLLAYVTLGVGIAFSAAAAYWLSVKTTDTGFEILNNGANYPFAVFEIVRSTAYAAFITGVAWVIFRIANSAFDQATRFEKRLMATHYMAFLSEEYRASLQKQDVSLKDVLAVLDTWSRTVESAFSHNKIPAEKGAGDISLNWADILKIATGQAASKKD